MRKELLKSITLAAILASVLPIFGQERVNIRIDDSEERKRISDGITYDAVSEPIERNQSPLQFKCVGKNESEYAWVATNYNDAIRAIYQEGGEKLTKSMNPNRNEPDSYRMVLSSQYNIKAGLAYFKEDIMEMLRINIKEGGKKHYLEPITGVKVSEERVKFYLESIFNRPFFASTNLTVIKSGYEKLRASCQMERDFCKGLERRAAEKTLDKDKQVTNIISKVTNNPEEKKIYEFQKVACPAEVQKLDKEISHIDKMLNVLTWIDWEQKTRNRITEYDNDKKVSRALRDKREEARSRK